VADLRELEVELAAPEKGAGKVAVGQACLVEVDAFPGKTFRGRVSRVRPSAGAAERGTPVRVKVEFTDKGPQLIPGMTGGVKVVGTDK
jgi:multidrug efflux pump subunit AcrA (membrane-fusion protein)